MSEVKMTIKLLLNLIITPITTVKSDEFETHNASLLNAIYYIISIFFFTGLLYSKFISKENFEVWLAVIVVIFSILISWVLAFLAKHITIYLYGFLLVLILKLDMDYSQMKIFLLPLIVIDTFITSFLAIPILHVQYLNDIVDVASNLWFNFMIFIFAYYKLQGGLKRSILTAMIPMVIKVLHLVIPLLYEH